MKKNYNGIIIAGILLVIFTGLVLFWLTPEGKEPVVSSESLAVSMPLHAGLPSGVSSGKLLEDAAATIEPIKTGLTADDSVAGSKKLPVQQENENYLIEGRVADSSTKAPVHDAVVQMASMTCRTDEEGVFRFTLDIAANTYQTAKIEKRPGYKTLLEEIHLQKGIPKQDLGFFYLAGDSFTGSIEGSVYDTNGLLLDGADIALFELNDSGKSIMSFEQIDLNSAKTKSAGGRYCFEGLSAGRYKLRASSLRFSALETGTFALSEGQKKVIDIVFLSQKIKYAGRVTDRMLNPVAKAMLFMYNKPDADDDIGSFGRKVMELVRTDSNGEFEIYLSEEVGQALVYKENFALVLTGISAGDGNNISLDKSKKIKGRVLQEGTDKPVSGLKVWLETDRENEIWYGAYGTDLKNFINEGVIALSGVIGEIYDGDQKINLYSLVNNPAVTDQNGCFEFSGLASFAKMRCRVANDSISVIHRTEFFTDDGADEKNIICRISSFAEDVEFAVIDAETGENIGPNPYVNFKAVKTDGEAMTQYFYWFMKNTIVPGLYDIEITCEGYVTLKTQLNVTLETSGQKITYKLEKDKRHPELLISGKVYENNLIAKSYNFVINPLPDERIGMGWSGYETNILTDKDGNYQFVLDSSSSMLEELKKENQKSGQVKLILHCYSNVAETVVEILLDEQDFLDTRTEKTADIYLMTK